MANRPIGKLDHIGIAVKSLAEARKFWEGVMGAQLLYEWDDPTAGYKLVELDLNGLTVELLEPLGDDSFLKKFIAKRGEGMHHLTFALGDVKGKAGQLKRDGVRVVDEREFSPTSYECFISPRSSHGVLIQLGSGYPTLARDPQQWAGKEK
jgi:methylmalonyl-CoA/ethylmalonyl-CoA epimerase